MPLHSEVANAFSLQGKVAVLTGAGSGLGQEAARIFSRAGARVVLSDINEEGLAETSNLLGSPQPDVLVRRVDVSRRDEVEALADWSLEETGRLDVWLNCAGVSYLHSLLETDPDTAQKVISINMMGPYWGCMAAGRVMGTRGGGTIVNISSGGGAKPLPGIAVYGMTKAAVNSLTWTCAAELGPVGVRVNAVAPGWIETPMARDLFRDSSGQIDPVLREKVRSQMARQSPLGILGNPSDIAFALLYLASDASRFVTGQILAVNGGESM
jgi:3-oxoacyl-[acyl-carrier protein] reductase